VYHLAWSWLAAPYLACAVAIAGAGLAAALVRGDRVLRVGLIGALASGLPWAVCSAIAACSTDPEIATRILRIGVGPVALVGPDILLVLLAISGQLERYRMLALVAAIGGGLLVAACWLTGWTVSGVRMLPAGLYYMTPGPLTGVHMLQLAVWTITGLVIARRATPGGERRRLVRLVRFIVVLGLLGGTDSLLLYDVVGVYPIAWAPVSAACVAGMYLAIRTDFLRPRGFDRGALVELIAFAVTAVAILGIAYALPGASALPFAAAGAIIWVIATASAWAIGRRIDAPGGGVRADDLVAELGDLADERELVELLASAWRDAIGIAPIAAWRGRPGLPHALVAVTGARAGEGWDVDPRAAQWLARRAEPVAIIDLATIRLGELRAPLEALGTAHGATLIVPLVDRGALVGIVEAAYDRPLREDERALVVASARAAARRLVFTELARAAARAGETAREVEVAEAMRLSASRPTDDAVGRWAVTAAYRSRPAGARGGASWSSALLPDGRLAVLVVEAFGPGLVAAVGTAALTGAFAAASLDAITLDALLATLRATADDVIREPVAAFVAILDDAGTLAWGTAGHPGGNLVADGTATALGGGGARLGASLVVATRGEIALPPGALLVIASSGLRGDDDAAWTAQLVELAPAAGALAQLVVDRAAARDADLLAVVVRARE
jgi:hypothetical protein